jgi:hypothetical protein
MVRRSRAHGLVLAVALTVLGSAALALVAVVSGTGGFDARKPESPALSGLAVDAATTPGGSAQPSDRPGRPMVPLSPPAQPPGAPTVPPVPPDQPNLVHRGSRTLLCPSGIVPMVQIQGATFSPPLTSGTSFGVGRYTITVRGRVTNETSAAIELRSLQITVDGRPWHGTTTVTPVAAQDFTPITFQGTYDSPTPHRAVVDSRLQWQWQARGLRPCGEEGLVEDD